MSPRQLQDCEQRGCYRAKLVFRCVLGGRNKLQAGVELLARLMFPSDGFDMVYDSLCLFVTSTSLPAKEDV